ncbi:MAG: hypothetical protein WBC44_05370 [Planctomycetaceae bacterium]
MLIDDDIRRLRVCQSFAFQTILQIGNTLRACPESGLQDAEAARHAGPLVSPADAALVE